MWSLPETDVSHGRLEQILLEGVLPAADHSCCDELEQPPPPMRPAAVKRVMDAVPERPAEPHEATPLAAITQVSLRTCRRRSASALGMSPMT